MPRSPWLMSPDDSGLVVIDVQEKLLPLIRHSERIAWNVGRLAQAAKRLGLPCLATEQYPKGLGPTVSSLKPQLETIVEKRRFSAAEAIEAWLANTPNAPAKLLLSGIETHICVQQTALDLLSSGVEVALATDAVGSRQDLDHEVALKRLEANGVTLTTTEAAMFEWCETSEHEAFKAISELVKLPAPPQ